MKRLILIGLGLVWGGCASVSPSPMASVEVMQRRFISLSQLHPGLSRSEVDSLLGQEVVSGYSLADDSSGRYKPITLPNPQRSETVKKGKKDYLVDYYVVGIKIADDKISDDELAPLVYYNDRLVGIGWDYVNKYLKDQ